MLFDIFLLPAYNDNNDEENALSSKNLLAYRRRLINVRLENHALSKGRAVFI